MYKGVTVGIYWSTPRQRCSEAEVELLVVMRLSTVALDTVPV